jgi:hypothetical protein
MNRESPELRSSRESLFKQVFKYGALACLLLSLVVIWLVLRKPPLPRLEPTPDAAQSFTEKVTRLTVAHEQGLATEIRLTEAEINAQIEEGLKDHPPPDGAPGLKGARVRLEGDRLIALLTMNVKGRDVYVTVGGNVKFADHSARLVPSEVRIGSLPVPASWVEGRIDMHMEVPDAISTLRVENSELVVATQ